MAATSKKKARPDAKYTGQMGLVAAFGAAVIGLIGNQLPKVGGDDAPTVALSEVEWLNDDGRYKVTGEVENLQPGQVV